MADDTGPVALSPRDRDLAIRTILGEAANQGDLGQAAVAHVIMNRTARGDGTPGQVVLKPGQFEPWQYAGTGSDRDPTLADPKSDAYQRAGQILDLVAGGRVKDFTNGATHFYSPSGQAAMASVDGRALTPKWAQGVQPTAQVGGHLFYAPEGASSYASAVQSSAPPAAPQAPPSLSQATPIAPMPQNTSQASPQDDVMRRWGIDPKALASDAPAAPALAATSDDHSDVMKRWGVDPAAVAQPPANRPQATNDVDPVTGMTVAKSANGLVSLLDPKTGKVQQQFLPEDWARRAADVAKTASGSSSFAEGALNGVPIVGPSLVSGVQKAAAATRALSNGTTFPQELANVQRLTQLDQTAHPLANTAGNVAGTGLAYLGASAVPGAPTLLGMSGPSLVVRSAAGAGSNALIGYADANARGENPITGAIFGGVGGAAAPAVGKVAGEVGGKAVNAIASLAPTGIRDLGRPAVNMLMPLVSADGPQNVASVGARLGENGMLADAGPSLRGLAGGLASKPGEAKSTIWDAIGGRHEGQTGRLQNDLLSSVGPAASPNALKTGIEAAQSAIGPQYERALSGASAVNTEPLANALDASAANLRGDALKAVREVRGYLNIPGTNELDPNPRALLATRHAIDGKLAVEADPNVIRNLSAARASVDDVLTQAVPGIKDVDAQYQELARQIGGVKTGTSALDNGKTTVWPQDFAQGFRESANPAGTLVGPSATPLRIQQGMRAEIERGVGTKPNDLVALKNTLQGENGWNTQKLETAFGKGPTNKLVNAVERESEFAATHNDVLRNSQTDPRAAARELLKETDPQQIDLKPSTIPGLALQGAKNFVFNPLMDMLMRTDNSQRNAQVARALTATGPERDALIQQLLPYLNRQQAAGSLADSVRGGADYGTNLLLRAGSLQGQR